MKLLLVNGVEHQSEAASLAAVLVELKLDDAMVATALNGEFVPVGQRAVTQLAAGDKIEILAPMQGG